MSTPTSPTSSLQPRRAPTREELLDAHQRRLEAASLDPDDEQEQRFLQEHDLRQSFRRLLDPGIMRGVEKKTALGSIKTLYTIANNLLDHPENEKFHQFKPTNTIIKKNLVEVKGALEYAVAMGFRAEVQDLQPYYVWNERKKAELRVGAAVLQEALHRETEKEERAARAKQERKAQAEIQARQVKLAFEDDRKRRALLDKMEKERRAALTAAAPAASSSHAQSPTSAEPEFHALRRRSGRSMDDDDEDDEEDDLLPGRLTAFSGTGQRLADPPPYSPERDAEQSPEEPSA